MKSDYNQVANQYKNYRIPDARIQALIDAQLANAKRVLNVGAGTGGYEPSHCKVTAIEPSEQMIKRRPAGSGMAIKGHAESLPFADNEFDAAMAILTIHHWDDAAKGLAEMRRVTRGKIVLLTWIDNGEAFWLDEYFPAIRRIDQQTFPTPDELRSWLGDIRVEVVPIPFDCSDGFLCAYWRRPEMYLSPDARQAISIFEKIGDMSVGLERLRQDLNSGKWQRRHAALLQQHSLDCGYRLVVAGE